MRDQELPVRVDSVFALRSFVEACKGIRCNSLFSCYLHFAHFFYLLMIYLHSSSDLGEIRPILPQLLDGMLLLINNEPFMFHLF